MTANPIAFPSPGASATQATGSPTTSPVPLGEERAGGYAFAQVIWVCGTKVYPSEGANALAIPGARIWVSKVS